MKNKNGLAGLAILAIGGIALASRASPSPAPAPSPTPAPVPTPTPTPTPIPPGQIPTKYRVGDSFVYWLPWGSAYPGIYGTFYFGGVQGFDYQSNSYIVDVYTYPYGVFQYQTKLAYDLVDRYATPQEQ